MDERTNGRTDERTNGRTDEGTNRRMGEPHINEFDQMFGLWNFERLSVPVRTDEWTNGQTDERNILKTINLKIS